jgi:hypothetical protein
VTSTILPFSARASDEFDAAGWLLVGPPPRNKDQKALVVCRECLVPDYRSLSLVRRNFGCPTCKGKGWVAAERLIRKRGFVPLPDHPYSGARAWWRVWCTACEQEVPIWYDNIRRGTGCGGCRGYHSDPAALVQEMLNYGFEPAAPFSGRLNDGWPSICRAEGHRVAPSVTNLRCRPEMGCAFCKGKALDPADAVKVMTDAGWIPIDEAFPGRSAPWPCRCRRCGQVSAPTYKAAKRGHGCRFCDKAGFDYDGPGFMYVLHNVNLRTVKPGITSERAEGKSRRRKLFARDGWDTQHLLRFARGDDAHRVEIAVHKALRDLGLKQALTKADMRFHGATETYWDYEVDADAVYEMAKATAQRLGVPFKAVSL